MPKLLSDGSHINDVAVNLIRDKAIYYAPMSGSSTTVTAVGGSTPAATGTITSVTLAHTSLYAAFRKAESLVTVAATTAVAGLRGSVFCSRGVSGYPNSGWDGYIRGGPATGVTTSTRRFFMGLVGGSSAPTDVQPSSIANIVGVGYDAADTNWQLMYNDASGTATKVDLGTARSSADRTDCFKFWSRCGVAGTTIDWSFMNCITGVMIGSGTINDANIPVATTALAPRIWSSVGGTSSVTGIVMVDWYYETSI